MTIDERLEKLVEWHEARAHTIELENRAFDERIVRSHEQRLSSIEGTT